MIAVDHIRKQYGKFVAVADVSLSIPKGELFGFIGPNGAGKTTTIKILGGLLAPSSGTVTISGIRMDQAPQKAKAKIGFIPDRPFLYEKLTGMEFLRFIADLYGVDEKRFFQKAQEQLAFFSLSQWPNELIESYSHGMKQRLIMASALIHDPEVIIVDEPTVGLDPGAVKLMKELFRRLSAQGVTLFMSTHTLSVAEEICDRIGVIRKGELIATGTVPELRQAAKTDGNLEDVFLTLTAEEALAS